MFPNEWSTLKKLIYLRGATGARTEESSGAIAHTSRGKSGAPLTKLVVDIDPVQDLHGYDSPWPAGGGANKANLETATVRNDGTYGMSVTIDKTAETITMSGTWSGAAAGSWRFLNTPDIDTSLSIKAFELTSGSHISYVTQDGAENRLVIQVNNMVSGTAYTISFKLFAYSGTAPTSWSPYSNLCPISGWTGAKVTRTGKNLLDENALRTYSNWKENLAPQSSGGSPTSYVNKGFALSGIEVGKTYTISFNLSNEFPTYLYFCHAVDGVSDFSTYITTETVSKSSYTFTAEDGVYYLRMGSTATESGFNAQVGKIHAPQLELGSTAYDYAPYQGDTYTIDLDGTVYGGELDALAGKLTANTAKTTIGDMAWEYDSTYNRFYSSSLSSVMKKGVVARSERIMSDRFVCIDDKRPLSNVPDMAIYEGGNGTVYIHDSHYSSAALFKTDMASSEIVYELATPIVIDVSPIAPTSLAGENNVWANCGDVDVVFQIA